MITEDYVSFETAKLLKEKGFDVSEIDALFPFVYYSDGKMDFYDDDKPLFVCEAVTLQMAMKWLREKYKLYVDVNFIEYQNNSKWCYKIVPMDESHISYNNCTGDSYEQSCEEAIKYCLENLV